jgi:3-methylcrotonyl-CoA carboxylase alpha subunit
LGRKRQRGRIFTAVSQASAEAIHSGNGFASENAKFADAIAAAALDLDRGARVVLAMGLKDAAKVLMQSASVPLAPGKYQASVAVRPEARGQKVK